MSTENDPSNPSGGPKPKKLKLKLKQKSGGKGLKKPSLKLGKKPEGKTMSLNPSTPSDSTVPPPGLTQPPMAKAEVEPLIPEPALEPTPANPDAEPSASLPPVPHMELPPVPEMELPPVPEAGESDSGSEEGTEELEASSQGDGLLPPPPSMEDPSAPEIPATLPPVPEMGLPPVPGAGNSDSGSEEGTEELEASSEGEGLLPPPPSMEELSAPEMPATLPPVPEMGLPTVPGAGDSDSGSEEGADEPEASSEGEGLLPPPPSMEELSAPEMPATLPPVPEMGLPPAPEAGDSDSGPEEGAEEPESTSDGEGLLPPPPSMEELSAPEMPATSPPVPEVELPPVIGSEEEQTSDDPQDESTENSENLTSNSTDSAESDEAESEENPFSTPPPLSETISEEASTKEDEESVSENSENLDDLNAKISSLTDELQRLKKENRDELDSLFKRVDELDEAPAASKEGDQMLEAFGNNLETLKSDLHEELESFKRGIETRLDEVPSGNSGGEFSSASSILSKTGEIKWKKDQYVVVSQDENAGNSSPLEVFISDSESEALEKIHSNMTAEKPIYFLFPSNLESLYQEKY